MHVYSILCTRKFVPVDKSTTICQARYGNCNLLLCSLNLIWWIYTTGERGRQRSCVTSVTSNYWCVFMQCSAYIAVLLLLTTSTTRRQSLVGNVDKHNYCHTCHTRFCCPLSPVVLLREFTIVSLRKPEIRIPLADQKIKVYPWSERNYCSS